MSYSLCITDIAEEDINDKKLFAVLRGGGRPQNRDRHQVFARAKKLEKHTDNVTLERPVVALPSTPA